MMIEWKSFRYYRVIQKVKFLGSLNFGDFSPDAETQK